jgi:quinone-modifying oxidoreductase subunit QmoC
MSEPYVLKPDKGFAEEIIKGGGDTLKQCYQCATCSVKCELSPDDRPFPRKEMIWAQWGLKDKLIGNPDVWLCHRCGDCSEHCPRGAKPGDVLASVRDFTIKHYAFPGFMGTMLAKPGLLPIMMIIPAIMMLVVLNIFGGHGHGGEHVEMSSFLGILPVPILDHVDYGTFFPHIPLQVFFASFAMLAVMGAVVGIRRFWSDMCSNSPASGAKTSVGSAIVGAIKDVFTHSNFKSCTFNKNRYVSHLLTFWGFAGLFIVTTGVVVAAYVFDHYPLPLWDPLKILGNLSALAMMVGVTWIIFERMGKDKAKEGSSGKDWNFILILYAVVVTGIITEVLRFANAPGPAYPLYFIHLLTVFTLLMYFPYSRFAHMVYRTVALAYARHSGRQLGAKDR